MSRIAVVGATGLIGTAVVAAIVAQGHAVTGIARSIPLGEGPVRWRELDIARADPAAIARVIDDAHLVINCAGALQEGPADDLDGVHAAGIARLAGVCREHAVRRIIHFSAMGVDHDAPTDFSRSKHIGDEALMASGVDWVILRPSVVIDFAVGGASALIRGLAGLPIVPVMPETGPLRPVALADVVATVIAFVDPHQPGCLALDLSGPETLSFMDLVRLHRRWLGFAPALEVPVPGLLARIAYRLGDLAGRLGWRPAVRSTARREVARGAAGDNAAWIRATGIVPRRIEAMLWARPASVQERWFARLYLLKPVIFASLVLFWIGSGLASLGPGFSGGVATMREAGTGPLAPLIVLAGGIADLLVGAGIAWRPTTRRALQGGLGLTLAYAIAGTVLTPHLWLDPLAALLKTLPIAATMLTALAVLEERA